MTKGEMLLRNPNLSNHIRELIAEELNTPLYTKEDRSLRIKATDRCGLTCVFCHNEGTPVNYQNNKQSKLRVSIYEDSNLCSFLPGPIMPNETFVNSISFLKDKLSLDEVHWTGGEPMLNKHIVRLSESVANLGLKVKMTSNGELGSKLISSLADAGVSSINYSIFGLEPREFITTQHALKRQASFAKLKISKVLEAIDTSINEGMDVKANIVVRNRDDYKKINDLIDKFGKSLKIMLLPDISQAHSSVLAIYELFSQLKANPVSRHFTVGSSNYSSDFLTPEGIQIGFKQIYRLTLPNTCAKCKLNNDRDCAEGYYGLRLYADNFGNYLIGICIHRMDLTVPISQFISQELYQEISLLKQNEFNRLISTK